MIQPLLIRISLLSGFLLATVNVAVAQQASKYPKPTAAQIEKLWMWTNAQWVGDDKPYQKIRAEIEQCATPDLLLAKFKEFQKSWEKAPTDFRVQFGWAYSAYKCCEKDLPNARHELMQYASYSLDQDSFPKTYEFMRIRFLARAVAQHDYHLVGLGKRLLQRQPRDFAVKYQLVDILSTQFSPQHRQLDLALTYAQQLVKEAPNRASSHAILGHVYMMRYWWKGEQLSDAEQGISGYERYLQLAPKGSYRKRAEELIKVLKEEQQKALQKANALTEKKGN